jgi:hypothetical protein
VEGSDLSARRTLRELGAGKGHRLHERPVAETRALPRRPKDSAGHQRRGARAARRRRRAEESHGNRSERGTRVAALFNSLIEPAKLAGVEPRAYLREATLRDVRNQGTVALARDLKNPES